MDLNHWPTEAQAAAQLGVTVRSIGRYAEKGRIEIRKRQREGKKAENVCNPRDIEKLLPAAHVMPEESVLDPPATKGTAIAQLRPSLSGPPNLASEFIALIHALAAALQADHAAAKPRLALWLSLEEAASFSGLSVSYIRDSLVASHQYQEGQNLIGIRGGPRGAWRINRGSLEAFAG